MNKKMKRICCYLSGETNCNRNDCFLVAAAGIMLLALLYGWALVI